jgi:hypothetical protein
LDISFGRYPTTPQSFSLPKFHPIEGKPNFTRRKNAQESRRWNGFQEEILGHEREE